MTLFVVGSGRCGTRSIAEAFREMGYDSHHEQWNAVTVQTAYYYITRKITPETAATIVKAHDWGEVEADYKLTELVPILKALYPDARFLWVQRDREATIESMCRKGWYMETDDITPDLYYGRWEVTANGPSVGLFVNYSGHRTKAWQVGANTLDEWRTAPQDVRCGWWVDWTHHLLEANLTDHMVVDIDTVTPDDLMRVAGWAFPDKPPARITAVPHLRDGGSEGTLWWRGVYQ